MRGLAHLNTAEEKKEIGAKEETSGKTIPETRYAVDPDNLLDRI